MGPARRPARSAGHPVKQRFGAQIRSSVPRRVGFGPPIGLPPERRRAATQRSLPLNALTPIRPFLRAPAPPSEMVPPPFATANRHAEHHTHLRIMSGRNNLYLGGTPKTGRTVGAGVRRGAVSYHRHSGALRLNGPRRMRWGTSSLPGIVSHPTRMEPRCPQRGSTAVRVPRSHAHRKIQSDDRHFGFSACGRDFAGRPCGRGGGMGGAALRTRHGAAMLPA